ncbi:unnamed protein product [Owenia fusiformis]|uniref:Uncharacterized protein n=1 Tax=Owenia fusiformis TaxID=6347 RepID=A0A8J1TGJ8_OWEFU|nr:unnamed protein product [Owenia fusiformis]
MCLLAFFRDLTNGYLVAEIFSWYYPQEIQMHSYNNGTSLDSKQRNWSLLKIFIKRHKLDIEEELLEGTIHCKEGAAQLLVERIYNILTNREVKKMNPEHEIDFTDRAYQAKLPMHARSTASQAVKNNLKTTEIMADGSIILSQQKSQHIINDHIENRRHERMEAPERFNIKPTLGELATRIPPPPEPSYTSSSLGNKTPKNGMKTPKSINSPTRESTVQFKEINVQQLNRPKDMRQPLQA